MVNMYEVDNVVGKNSYEEHVESMINDENETIVSNLSF
jgi:hypothetical protein